MKSFACFLLLFTVSRSYGQTSDQPSPTYRTVAPIILKNCVPCHRQGDAAPFSLATYADVAKRLTFIKDVISNGYMPPWKADSHYRDFANTRALTDQERITLLQWIDKKAPRGDDKEPDPAGSSLMHVTTYNRKPDLTLTIDSPFVVQGDNAEKFIVFKVPFELAQANNIEAVEFYCNNKRIVHHVNYGFYEVADTSIHIFDGQRVLNTANDDRSKPDVFGPFKKKMTYYTGWIPGASYENYPRGFGWVLPKRGVVMITVHYTGTAADEKSIVGVNLFFNKEPVKRTVEIISLGSGGVAENDIDPPFFIPANKVTTFHLRVKTQDEQSLMYVWPHMHLVGKEFYAYAVTPDNDTIKLVHIPDWDFKWQELYKFKNLIRIPKGSVIHMDCTYDNTAGNPSNPNSPPSGILSLGDMSSTSEMMTLLLIYTPYREGDEQVSLNE